jgi:tRNA nucleotidyltransferase (CCA-adding enzyme)
MIFFMYTKGYLLFLMFDIAGDMVSVPLEIVKNRSGMDVITTHIDAEFDSFASMVAAGKLYPGARLVFPGSQEKALRRYLRASPKRFGVHRVKSIDLDKVERLIVVDTRRRDRIGAFASIVDREGLEIHIYDHHPPTPFDLSGPVEVIEDVGANITLMVEALRERKLAVTPEEATLFAIALYEDTGSLTFGATTPRDLRAGAYLLEQGANLNVVADNLGQELTTEQVMLLNDLLKGLKKFTIQGVEVSVATASTTHYVSDLAVVTHRLKDMQSLNVLFVAAKMGDRIHLVGRSRIEMVDAGAVAFRFGGGGHPTAASATVRGISLSALVRKLKTILRSIIPPPLRAREMMTSPVKTLDVAATLSEARRFQIRTGLHILPVVSTGRFLGLITRPVTEKAIRHGFAEAPAADYMNTEVQTVTPSATFFKVEEIMVHQGQRFLPVLQRGRVVGAITRTDYLRALRREASRRPPFGYEHRLPRRGPRKRDMSALIKERLPGRMQSLLEVIGKEGDRQKVSVYLVGGVVRDLLLNEKNLDVDIMVEGDGIAFARRLGKVLKGRVNAYKRFETAVVVLPDGRKIDVATARSEYYEHPGAFPKVEYGTIKMDLFRRDFTINALALQLNMKKYGTLHDFFGGQKDLEDRMIRVLHNLSFVEDPTRVFRAIRFETRLHFQLGEVTHKLIKDTVSKDLLVNIVGRRLFGELVQILREKSPLPALARMEELDVLKYIHPKMKVTRTVLRLLKRLMKRFDELGEKGEGNAYLCLAALSESLGSRQREDLMERLAVPSRLRKRILSLGEEGRRAQRLLEEGAGRSPGELYELLVPFDREAVIYAWARTSRRAAAAAAETYLTKSIHVSVLTRGRDLKAMEYPPGPFYRTILAALLKEKIDGASLSRKEERAWILKEFPLPARVPSR